MKALRFSERRRAKQLSILLGICEANVQRSTFNVQRSMIESEKTLTINEIFYSIQGESTFAGRPCVFVRLTACDLRCSWCDTAYAFDEGRKRSLDDIVAEVDGYGCSLVEVTGGEPLLQEEVYPLM